MAAPSYGAFGCGGRGREVNYDLGFQPGFNPGRGGRGAGRSFGPHRGRGGYNGYSNHDARNSGAHYYGGSRPYGADRGIDRRRGRWRWHSAANPNLAFSAPQQLHGGIGAVEGFPQSPYGGYQHGFAGGQHQQGGGF